MDNIGSIPILVLFGISTLFLYLAVRRRWVTLTVGAIGGATINSVLFFLYSLSRQNVFQQAIVVGPLAGIVFTGIAIAVAVFFRNNEMVKRR